MAKRPAPLARIGDVRRLAKSLGCTVTVDKDRLTHEIRVTAPQGYIFNAELHQLVETCYVPWTPDYDDLMARMKHGVRLCDVEGCEWCNPETGE
jgi:hypothetical protein